MTGTRSSLAPLAHGLPAAGLVLALFTYWFGYANRHEVFLYEHLGATPFDAVTRGRYLMAGLVAAGAVQVLYVAATWSLGRMPAWRGWAYRPPPWPQAWLAAAPWIVVGVPAIQGDPPTRRGLVFVTPSYRAVLPGIQFACYLPKIVHVLIQRRAPHRLQTFASLATGA